MAERSLHRLRDLLELAIAIELVAEQVEDDRSLRLDLIDGFGKACLVDLEDPPVRSQATVRTGASQRGGGRAEDEVRARAV